jgi:hypothetical protein
MPAGFKVINKGRELGTGNRHQALESELPQGVGQRRIK